MPPAEERSAGPCGGPLAVNVTVVDILEPQARSLCNALRRELDRRGRCGSTAGPIRLGPQDPSTRERRVLRALSGSITLREIADELFVSHNTVKTQVRTISHKLDAHDRSVAVARARAHGVL
jgi:LuxR family maltose regulon positive regulatory protein